MVFAAGCESKPNEAESRHARMLCRAAASRIVSASTQTTDSRPPGLQGLTTHHEVAHEAFIRECEMSAWSEEVIKCYRAADVAQDLERCAKMLLGK